MCCSLDLNPGHLLLALCSSQLLSCTGSVLLDTALLAWAADQWVLGLEAAGSPQGQVCGRSFQQLVWRCPESAPVGQGSPRPGVGMRSWCSQGKVNPEELPAYPPATLFQLLALCELSGTVPLSSGLLLEDYESRRREMGLMCTHTPAKIQHFYKTLHGKFLVTPFPCIPQNLCRHVNGDVTTITITLPPALSPLSPFSSSFLSLPPSCYSFSIITIINTTSPSSLLPPVFSSYHHHHHLITSSLSNAFMALLIYTCNSCNSAE